MGPQRKGLPAKLLTLILNIGADPRDSEYIRLVKRIWYVATVISLPTSLYAAISKYWIGDVFAADVLFTDGIVEARNGEGEEYTEKRFREAVARSRGLPAAEVRRRILEDARSFAATGQPCDDITLVVVKRTGA